VRRGETLRGLARREGIELSALLAWNALTEESVVRAGQRLMVERPGVRPPARSIGRASDGRLAHGEWLGEGKGYRLRFPKNAYGTAAVNQRLRTCSAFMHALMPWSADLLIGDLSRPGGGRFPPHESHQSGRDADVGYYLADNVQNATLHRVGRDMMDPAKTWLYMRCLIAGGDVVRMYVDTSLQRALVAYLKEHGAETPEQLARLFEVEGGPEALIQHARHHDTHLHVRFACAPEQDAPAPSATGTPAMVPDEAACALEPREAPFKP
jgi:murein endopeptidase